MQKFVGELQMAAARARMAGVSRERDGKAHAMSQLADALKDSGDFDGALKLYQKVLKNDTARLGPDHLVVAKTYSNIGIVYEKQAKYPEAIEMHEKSLAIKIKVHGPDHLSVADTYNKCANAHPCMP